MTYELLSNWQLLPNTENIYYQEVTKDNDKQEFYVIKGNEITVKEEVTKKMLNDLNQNGAENFPALTITAYAIQRDSEIESISTAEKAWTLISEQS